MPASPNAQPSTPATDTTAATAGRKPRAKREGPDPSHALIAAIRDAWQAGVPFSDAKPFLDMAIASTGVTGWKMLSDTLTMYAKAAKPATDAAPAKP